MSAFWTKCKWKGGEGAGHGLQITCESLVALCSPPMGQRSVNSQSLWAGRPGKGAMGPAFLDGSRKEKNGCWGTTSSFWQTVLCFVIDLKMLYDLASKQ